MHKQRDFPEQLTAKSKTFPFPGRMNQSWASDCLQSGRHRQKQTLLPHSNLVLQNQLENLQPTLTRSNITAVVLRPLAVTVGWYVLSIEDPDIHEMWAPLPQNSGW